MFSYHEETRDVQLCECSIHFTPCIVVADLRGAKYQSLNTCMLQKDRAEESEDMNMKQHFNISFMQRDVN